MFDMDMIIGYGSLVFIFLLIFYRKRIARILNFIGEYGELKIMGALGKLFQKIEDETRK